MEAKIVKRVLIYQRSKVNLSRKVSKPFIPQVTVAPECLKIPDLSSLRQDAWFQARVNECLKELQDGEKTGK